MLILNNITERREAYLLCTVLQVRSRSVAGSTRSRNTDTPAVTGRTRLPLASCLGFALDLKNHLMRCARAGRAGTACLRARRVVSTLPCALTPVTQNTAPSTARRWTTPPPSRSTPTREPVTRYSALLAINWSQLKSYVVILSGERSNITPARDSIH